MYAVIISLSNKRFQFGNAACPHANFRNFETSVAISRATFALLWFPSMFCRKASNDTIKGSLWLQIAREALVPIPESSFSTSSSSLETGVGGRITCSNVGCPFKVQSTTLKIPSCLTYLFSTFLPCEIFMGTVKVVCWKFNLCLFTKLLVFQRALNTKTLTVNFKLTI